ncbi:MAG TPA: hypothetical protein VF401_04685 [Candidatus Saccharimonadales bacterium]
MLKAFAWMDLGGPLIIVALVVLVFEIYMLINAIQNTRISQNAKILWIVGMLLIHPIVAIAYYFTDYKKA